MTQFSNHPRIRLGLLFLSGVCLVGALGGGLVRLGWWNFSPFIGGLPGIHGPLIICGFLGTFFSLERAVATKKFFAYFAPFLTVAGSLVLVFQPMGKGGPGLVVAGSLFFLALCLFILVRRFALYSLFIFLGSFQWFMGNLIWMASWPVYNVTLWWMSFVILTTVGERLEIAQMTHVTVKAKTVLLAGVLAVFVGHVFTSIGHLTGPDSLMDLRGDSIYDPRVKMGMKLAGIGIFTVAGWFLTYDSARSRLQESGMAGYIALCMVSSYVWLALSGIFSFVFAGLVSGTLYDTIIHAFFLGFLMFMVLGHGPILIPAILGGVFRMRTFFYALPALLHASLLLRIVGNGIHSVEVRKLGGLLNAAAVILFLGLLFLFLFIDNRDELENTKETENA